MAMRMNRGKTGSSCQLQFGHIRDVFLGFFIDEPLGNTQVHHVNNVRLVIYSNQEVVWLNVPVKKVHGMEMLYSLQ